MTCEHCEIRYCPVLNPTECPINQLWQKADEAQATIAEAERFLRETGKGNGELCPTCGARYSIWREVFGEEHHCP